MRTRARLLPFLPLLLGIGAGIVGLLPWLVHGMRLPLQNLWATAVTDAGSPVVLLPFSQYALSLLAAVLVVGGAVGGLVLRALPGERSARRVLLAAAGVLVVQVVALVQTAQVVGGGLQQRTESAVYLGLLVAGSVFSILVGLGVLVLLAARHRAAVVVGAGLAAVLLPSWLNGLVVAPMSPWQGPTWILEVPRWLAPIGVGVAVAWSGLRTPGRIAAALFTAVALWIGPALVTAVTAAAGTRIYARDPGAMLDYGASVFRSAAGLPDLVVPPLLVAAAIAAVGIVALRLGRRGAAAEG